MPSSDFLKVLLPLALSFLTVAAALDLPGQNTQPTPTPTGSPSPSPSATPPRTPTPTPLPGAQNFHQWGSITVFNGLPSDSVRAIAQTPDGVMWFGTDNGLARFDGRRIQNFFPGDPSSHRVLALKTSSAGELWVGTSAGAFIHNGNRFQSIERTEGVGITAIYFGTSAYVATDGGFLMRVVRNPDGTAAAEKLFSEPVSGPDAAPVAITGVIETDGRLIFATSGRGLFSFKPPDATAVNSPPSPPGVNSIIVSRTGEPWIGTDALRDASGIYRSTGSNFERIAAPTAKVLILEENDGGIWAGTERFGLFHIVGSKLKKNYTFENTSGGLRSNNIFTLFTDREGVLWIGTNRGVSRFDRLGALQETVSDIPNSNFIRVLHRTRTGKLYAGSNRGLFAYDGEKWSPVGEYGIRPIFALAEDGSGRLLVGTTGRVAAPEGAASEIRAFANFRGDTFEAVFGSGLHKKRAAGGDQIVHSASSLTALLGTPEKLWVGSVDHGILSFDGTVVKPEFPAAGTGAIRKLFQSDDGVLWIAAEQGVFARRDDRLERVIDAADVRDVLVKGTDVWAATTTRGLVHARYDQRFGWLTSAIAFEQGLPSEKAFSIIPDGDKLLIGTNRGVVSYGTSAIGPKIIATRVLSQRVHDLSELASMIPLEYPQNSILIEVAGQSSRTFPEEFQYAFVLKNTKGEEVDRRLSNESQYAPADLSPGEYTIEAIAFNRDLVASDALPISFSIAKAPFPWTATALGALLAMSLVALVWAVIERRRIKERNRELAAARLDLANEAERERRRIARDLHDQTLADLRNLMMTTDKHPERGVEIRKEIESISTDIRRICEDLSPSVLENVGLVAALEFLVSHTIEKYTFHADENLEEKIALPLHVQLQIYRITQEVLTNITRHSDATEVEMNIESTDAGGFHLSIRDNGRVFQPDGGQHKGRGISNIRSRANLIHGEVAWKESRSGGNVFSLRVQLTNEKTLIVSE